MTLLHRKVAVKVQSLSLLLEMNKLEDDQSLPEELLSNLTVPVPIFDPSTVMDVKNLAVTIGFLFSWVVVFDYLKDTVTS